MADATIMNTVSASGSTSSTTTSAVIIYNNMLVELEAELID